MSAHLKGILAGLIAAGFALPAAAADLYTPEPTPIEPAPIVEAAPDIDMGSWYIRGDIDYHQMKMRGSMYAVTGGWSSFNSTDIGSSWSAGLGVGYNVTKHFRVDVTGEHWAKAGFRGTTSGTCGFPPVACNSTDTANVTAYAVLANAYADLGTYHGITPYVGAGVGIAHVKWSNLRNTAGGVTTVHPGGSSIRGVAAVMAGASYCLTDRLELDAGYRYAYVGGGQMFQYANGAGPGADKGFGIHEARAGLRYSFGGRGASTRCSRPETVVQYTPEPVQPVFK